MLITGATLLDGGSVDIRVHDTIVAVGPALTPQPDELVLDAAHATVLPGLHDHHVHLRSAAAALASVPVGPPTVRTADDLKSTLYAATPDADGWIRAVGYHDSVAGALDRRALDALAPPTPVRVQHRSGALWILNGAALARVGATDHPDGRFFRTDPATPGAPSLRLADLSARLTGYGITGVTDATPSYTQRDIENFSSARRSGALRQRLYCMAVPGTRPTDQVGVGPTKKILDDTTLDLAELTRWVTDTHAAGRPVAVHAVTDAQLVLTIAALRDAGTRPGDRIEHAAVLPDDCLPDLVELRVTVVTQPNFVAERGDEYLAEVEAAQHDQLWRVAALRSAGVPVALSTDTPFGDGDPWAAMRAAVHRRTRSGAILGAAEAISPRAALDMFLGGPDDPATPRRIAPGEPGDLCVLDAAPHRVLGELDAGLVGATIIGGTVISG